jgi:hypothetical protein
MQAITVRDRAAGVGGLSLGDAPHPHAAQNDVMVQVHAAGSTPGELDWPTTWTDRAGRDRRRACPATSCPESSSNWARDHWPHGGPTGIRTDRLGP